MSTRIAEEKIGGMATYKYPERLRSPIDPDEWMQKWMTSKFVLLGWEVVKRGVVAAFKNGRSRHLVRRVYSDHEGMKRPQIQVACGIGRYPLWNWQSPDPAKKVPAVLLSEEQSLYFPICKRCEALIKKMVKHGR
jgi:hypothetical protein